MRSEDEKMLGANLPSDFVERFWSSALPKDVKGNKTEIVTAMATAWLDMGDELKTHYLHGVKGEPGKFRDFIETIVESKLRDLFPNLDELVKRNLAALDDEAAAQAAAEVQRRKKDQKGAKAV